MYALRVCNSSLALTTQNSQVSLAVILAFTLPAFVRPASAAQPRQMSDPQEMKALGGLLNSLDGLQTATGTTDGLTQKDLNEDHCTLSVVNAVSSLRVAFLVPARRALEAACSSRLADGAQALLTFFRVSAPAALSRSAKCESSTTLPLSRFEKIGIGRRFCRCRGMRVSTSKRRAC